MTRFVPDHAHVQTLARAALLLMSLALPIGALTGCAGSGGGNGGGAGAPAGATEQRPDRAVAGQEHVAQADELAKEGKVAEALAELARAIEVNPTLDTAFVRIGDIHKEQGNYAAAETAYAEASRLNPGDFHSAFNHGLTLQLLDRVNDAVKAYLRALRIRPDDRDANLNLATAYFQLGEPRQALPFAERAALVDPNHGPSRVNLGAVYSALGRHQEAVAQYEAAAEILDLDASPELLLNLADALGRIGRHQEMANTLERLVASTPSAQAYERLGSAKFRLRDYEGALAAFRRSVELDPRHYPARNGVGVCLLNTYLLNAERDRAVRDDAVRALRESLKINPRQPKIVELVAKYGG